MANALKELSASLREAVRRAGAYTVTVERRPYPVSGVLIGDAKVLTADHLVAEDEDIGVLLPDGSHAKATVAGRDPAHDLALLRLEKAVSAATQRPASLEVGDIVLSLRRDPFDGINAGLGIVSAVGSKLRLSRAGVLERYLQMDATRTRGSTGGPLADAEGGFAGIQVFNQRFGAEVAIPADLALERAATLETKGSIKRPWLGIRSQVVEIPEGARKTMGKDQESGLLIVSLEKGSPADRAGLQVGDILIALSGTPIREHGELIAAMADLGAGAEAKIDILRGGSPRSVSAAIGGA